MQKFNVIFKIKFDQQHSQNNMKIVFQQGWVIYLSLVFISLKVKNMQVLQFEGKDICSKDESKQSRILMILNVRVDKCFA